MTDQATPFADLSDAIKRFNELRRRLADIETAMQLIDAGGTVEPTVVVTTPHHIATIPAIETIRRHDIGLEILESERNAVKAMAAAIERRLAAALRAFVAEPTS